MNFIPITLAKRDTKTVYKIINSLLSTNNEKLLPENTNKLKLANEFSKYFEQKVNNIIKNITDLSFKTKTNQPNISGTIDCPSHITPLTHFNPIDAAYLQELISRTKLKFSSVDNIPAELLNTVLDVAFDDILEIINTSFYQGIFPDCLKVGHITPIIKDPKGDINSYSNYRPIFSLPILSKLIEKAALDQLINHIHSNHLCFKYQSGFKKNHSCETALLKIYQDLINVLEPNQYIVMLFLDFSSAFDTVNHQHLINKLKEQFYVQDNALHWFKDFLTNRRFCTKIEDTFSDWNYVNHGVPQGSVLGPAVFSLYTQEIGNIASAFLKNRLRNCKNS